MKYKSLFLSLVFGATMSTAHASGPLCPNHFPNFLRDICWSCMYPIKLFGQPLSFLPGAKNNSDFKSGPSGPVCACLNTLSLGTPMSFWEQSNLIDVHTEPGCMPALGGLRVPMPWNKSQYGKIETDKVMNPGLFRHATYYVSPMMYLLEMLHDSSCTDRSPFDVGWQSEFDPTWDDDELSLIQMPVSFAFGSIPAVLAGGVDTAASQVGFGINRIFWQAGSLGPVYPLTGNVKDFYSPDQANQLIAVRMLATGHAMKELANLFGKGGGRSYGCEPGEVGCTSSMERQIMCAGEPASFPQVTVMPKRQYKLQRTAPVPATAKVDLGQCCHPIGRNPFLTEYGTTLPLPGYKDFVYSIFRKRDCCVGIVSPNSVR